MGDINSRYPDIPASQGVDWLTATSPKDEVGQAWYGLFLRYTDSQNGQELVSDAKNRYYEGRKCGPVFWGYAPKQGYIMQISGRAANEFWRKVCPSAKNVSRLDLQVTATGAKHRPNLIDAYELAVAEVGIVAPTYWRKSRDAKTVYCGSRNSAQFGRIYDKGAEQGGAPGYVYRYEVQLGDNLGKPASEYLLSLEGDDADKGIKSFVHRWFLTRGARPIFSPMGQGHIVSVGRDVTTADRKLNWLRSQVAPTIAKLEEMGRLPDALNALGLQPSLFDD